ncbi:MULTISPECIES: alpha/beta family hydrolase [Priestia]|uniref:alpha/beta family hydrolase n=1 Tax=Priestia TaxID=2800373 RepID=UPI00077CC7B8|nr:alpha/beta family hydrolase [Priestia flexa]MED4590120.1 alpha/beta hydrolase [Priestia flexa]
MKQTLPYHSVPYTHIHRGSKKVCIMLSGLGYHYEKPLFYYSTMLMLEEGIDVVHVHYSYNRDFLKQSLQIVADTMMKDIEPILMHILETYSYEEIIFIGKSLGTVPILHNFMKQDRFAGATMLLLTPLLNFPELFTSLQKSRHQGLLVIGDQDVHYDKQKLQQLHMTNFQIDVIKDGDHSLDVHLINAHASLTALMNVMNNMKKSLHIVKQH